MRSAHAVEAALWVAGGIVVYWGLLHRAIFWELFQVFSLALVALTGILLMGGIFAEATQRGLTPLQVLFAIPLLIPSTLPYTLPTTTLLATCVVYGRLANDNEIVAVRAAGVTLLQVVWPGVILGVVSSGVTFGLYMDVIPRTYDQLRCLVVTDVEELLYSVLRRDGRLRHSRIGYDIFVKRVDGKRLVDALFLRRDPKANVYDIISRAREATIRVDSLAKQVIVTMHQCHIAGADGQDEGFFLHKEWAVDLPDIGASSKDRASQLNWRELGQRRAALVIERDGVDTDIKTHVLTKDEGEPTESFSDHLRNLGLRKKHVQQRLAEVVAEQQLRPSIAFGCLCFVLAGCPVGIWFSKSDYLSAFITCFLPIVVVYYPLLLCGLKMSQSGTCHPLAIWGADAVLLTIAMYLLHRLLRS